MQESSCFRFYSVLCGPPFPSLIHLEAFIDDDQRDERRPLHGDHVAVDLENSSDEKIYNWFQKYLVEFFCGSHGQVRNFQ